MDALNSAILGVWFPILYIVHGIIFKKINFNKFILFISILFLLALNWMYIGRIQNVHIIGLGVLAVFLFPPNIRMEKFMVMIGIISVFILLVNNLIDHDEKTRSSLFFGPNTDAAILLMMLTPLVYNKNKFSILLYLLLAGVVLLSTQSRSSILLIAPIALLIFSFSDKYLLKDRKFFFNAIFSIIIYISSTLVIFLIYNNIEILYLLGSLDLESRWSFASYASDLDRLTAFVTAQEVAFKNWSSILIGADILPSITGASNVVHSEIFSVLFGGGLILFLPISILLMHTVFYAKNRFSIIYSIFYLMASGFSTSLFSFPFLFMVNSLLNKINHSTGK